MEWARRTEETYAIKVLFSRLEARNGGLFLILNLFGAQAVGVVQFAQSDRIGVTDGDSSLSVIIFTVQPREDR